MIFLVPGKFLEFNNIFYCFIFLQAARLSFTVQAQMGGPVAFRPAVSRGLAFSKVAGLSPCGHDCVLLLCFDTHPESDDPGNISWPDLHRLTFVVCAAGIAPAKNLVCLEALPIIRRAHALVFERNLLVNAVCRPFPGGKLFASALSQPKPDDFFHILRTGDWLIRRF